MNRPANLLAALTLVALCGCAVALAQSSAHEPGAGATTGVSPFYCDMGALTPAERKRHFEVLEPALIAKRLAVRELPDGYEFQLPADTATFQQAAEYIEAERRCCPFFDIDLRLSPQGGPLWLRFTGRPGTKQFVQADGAEWLRPLSTSAPR